MNKQPEITDATRETFVDAFFQLAKIKNINQITIREITNVAGYNRTTFYRYFQDVYALIEYAEDDFFQETQMALRNQGGGDAIYTRAFFETFINSFHENIDRVSILMSEQNRSHFIRRMRENVMDSLNQQIADTPKKEVVTNMFFMGAFSAVATHLQNTKALSREDLLDIIQKLATDWYWPQILDENSFFKDS
ncbi:MAG: TetR/AcrR family transcriptional regulator [Clostridiales bacterium]|nr:TetR/AcrR family transcriptional regulator [Clostridiales bacterium]